MSFRTSPVAIWVVIILGSSLLGVIAGNIVSTSLQQSQKESALSRRAEQQVEILQHMGTLEVGTVLVDHDFDRLDHTPVRLSEVVDSTTVLSIIDPDCGVCLDEINSLCKMLQPDVFERNIVFISGGNPRFLVETQKAYDRPLKILYDHNRVWLTKYDITTFPFNIVIDSQLKVTEIIAAQLIPDDLKRLGLVP